MSNPTLKHRLSTLDATFLYYERKEAPFHVGSTMIFDGEITAKDFELMLSARLPLIPRYQQKVVPPPFDIGYPSWEFDPDFDIKKHIFQVQLDPPGTMEQLRILTSRIQAVMLDRSKPLWEIYIVNGLQRNRTAIISKVHHSMVDGVSGVELMNISLDHSADPPSLPPTVTVNVPTSTRPSNSIFGLWLDSLLEGAMDISDNWFQLQKGLLTLGAEALSQSGELIASPSNNPLVTLATPVSLLPFNQPNSGNLDLNWLKLSFTEAHAIEEKLGGTVNDVMLCAISGAIIRYMEKHGYKTDQSKLRFFVPVNTRHKEDTGTMGNMVSALPVEVPLHLQDSLERYHYIVNETLKMKKGRVADQFSLLLNVVGIIPPPLQALVGSLMYTAVPLVNMVCTNVPGPHSPLYILGKKMTDSYSYVPFAYAVGLTAVIFSYNHELFITLSSDGSKMPGLGKEFMQYLAQTFAELRDFAGILHTDIPEIEPLIQENDNKFIPAKPEIRKSKARVRTTRESASRRRSFGRSAANVVEKNSATGSKLETLPETNGIEISGIKTKPDLSQINISTSGAETATSEIGETEIPMVPVEIISEKRDSTKILVNPVCAEKTNGQSQLSQVEDKILTNIS